MLDPKHFLVLAGQDVVDMIRAERVGRTNLIRHQIELTDRGYRGAEIVKSISYGWQVRYDNALLGWHRLAGCQDATINGSLEDAERWAKQWQIEDPTRRYVWRAKEKEEI